MKMTKFLLVLAFLIVMAAGAVVGMAVDRQLRQAAPVVEPPRQRAQGPKFPKLDPEQTVKFKAIWDKVDGVVRSGRDSFRELERQRHDEVRALLNPDQIQKVSEIDTRVKNDEQKLNGELVAATQVAEQETLAMMSPEQQKEYKDYRAWQQAHGRRGPGRGTRAPRPQCSGAPRAR